MMLPQKGGSHSFELRVPVPKPLCSKLLLILLSSPVPHNLLPTGGLDSVSGSGHARIPSSGDSRKLGGNFLDLFHGSIEGDKSQKNGPGSDW